MTSITAERLAHETCQSWCNNPIAGHEDCYGRTNLLAETLTGSPHWIETYPVQWINGDQAIHVDRGGRSLLLLTAQEARMLAGALNDHADLLGKKTPAQRQLDEGHGNYMGAEAGQQPTTSSQGREVPGLDHDSSPERNEQPGDVAITIRDVKAEGLPGLKDTELSLHLFNLICRELGPNPVHVNLRHCGSSKFCDGDTSEGKAEDAGVSACCQKNGNS